MLQIYHGDGKGKTTAAVGLCVRALGNHIPVVFAQFLKDGKSGEIIGLKKLGAKILIPEIFYGFVRGMSEKQREALRDVYKLFLQQIQNVSKEILEGAEGTDKVHCVVVLDEVLHACNNGLLEEEVLLSFLEDMPEDVEIVCTGYHPSKSLVERADYCSCIQKEKHPYDKNIAARLGIER